MAGRKQFLLRIDPQVWEELEAWAADDLRSVNGQIEFLLREAVRRRKGVRQKDDQKGPADEGPSSGQAGG